MCNKICIQKLQKQTLKIKIDETLKNNQNLVFGEKVDINFLKNFDENSCCKNCVYNKK